MSLWVGTDDTEICAVLTEALAAVGLDLPLRTEDAERLIKELRSRQYDIVPSPVFQGGHPDTI